MKTDGHVHSSSTGIQSISCRRILNSHAEFTHEFIVELDSGAVGTGSSPQGETISIYEDKAVATGPERIIETINKDRYLHVPLDQESFDDYLERKIPAFGRNNSFALSVAFYNAAKEMPLYSLQGRQIAGKQEAFPLLCLNILNGGNHAYTNPVLSDFPEYLVVSNGSDIETIIRDHGKIQEMIRDRLLSAGRKVINGNAVSAFNDADNRSCIEVLLRVLEALKLSDAYDLMIDASAGDLWSDDRYRFSVTDGSTKTSRQLCEYWLGLIADYNIRYLEDPFHEKDYESWARLTAGQRSCRIIGDNLYSSDASRMRLGAVNGYTHGAIVKPNQAGTVTATVRAIKEARRCNQTVITSHRSISTESLFLSTVTHMFQADAIKIGPLFTDYSSVMRLNELMRLRGQYE